MSKINESMLTNLASVLTGAAIGKYLGNRLKSKKSTEKAAQKILSQNPENKFTERYRSLTQSFYVKYLFIIYNL